MTRTIGIGVIGMGWMGMLHSQSYQQIPYLFADSDIEPHLVICADEVEARAQKAKRILGFERYSTDWRDVIADPDVQVVNITAPNNLHVEIVKAAAAAGKHIMCEKPVGRNPQETAEIEYAARQAGVLSFVGFNYRWAPLVQYTQQLIQEGKLGKLTHYRGRFFAMYGSNPNSVLSWRFQEDVAGLGTLGDLMSHVGDMAHMLVGPVKRLVASRETFIQKRPLATYGEGTHFTISTGGPQGEVTNEDYVGAMVEFENGTRGTFEVCRAIFGPKCEHAFEINGTQGAVSWNFEKMNELHAYLPDGTSGHDGYTQLYSGPEHPFHASINPGPAVALGYNDLKVIEAHQFLKSVAENKQGVPGFAEALAVAELQDAMIRSWESGTWEDVKSLRK
ncbi:MAG: Gfo/Idh/MocA family oxidoreductase [Burkholderiales bacterium]|nr:Gfo/Idh/MocA family oxidoreductase [Anaerolineae bacterium]